MEITKKEAQQAVAAQERTKAEKRAKKSFMSEVTGAIGYGVGRRMIQEKTDLADKLPGGMLALDGAVAGYGLLKGTKRGGGKAKDFAVGAGMVALGHIGDYVGGKLAAAIPSS